MKSVLITGATGFIGSYLVQEFVKDHKVICLVRPGTLTLNRISEFLDDVLVVEHDIQSDLQTVSDIIGPVDIVLHAAGNPSALDSIVNPIAVIKDNVIGTANLLEFARSHSVERFVYYSSGEVFGPVAIGQDSQAEDVYNCNSPYSASKAAGEEISLSYAKAFNLPVSIVHINNTFGPKCQVNRLPTVIINNILNGTELVIHTDELGTISGRRWFHAEDVALHTRFILTHQISNCEKWNSAGYKFINNLDFAQLFASALGTELKYRLEPIADPSHKLCFSIDPGKFYNLGYIDPFSIEQRVSQTVAWYRKNPDWLK